MRTAVDVAPPRILDLIARLRPGRPAAARTRQELLPIPLQRARPEFRRTSVAEIATAMAGPTQGPLRAEISRLAGLYAPVLAPKALALRPAGLLKLDVRCPVERVAAGLAFHALRGRPVSAANH